MTIITTTIIIILITIITTIDLFRLLAVYKYGGLYNDIGK